MGASAAGAIEMACSSDAATPSIEPITGIQIRAERLLAGRGCGKKNTMGFKYAAVVKDSASNVRAAGLYDCFADALFQNLVATGPDGGSPTFTLDVFVFNAVAYEAAGNAETIRTVIDAANRGQAPDPSVLPSTWITRCRATEQVNIESVAECDPLVSADATSTVRVGTQSFAAVALDGGAPSTVSCGTDFGQVVVAVGRISGLDGGSGTVLADAGASGDAAADAGDGGIDAAAGAGADAGGGGDAGDGGGAPPERQRSVNCPDPADFQVPTLQDASLEVELWNGTSVVGRTTCTAYALPRTVVTATCKPVQR